MDLGVVGRSASLQRNNRGISLPGVLLELAGLLKIGPGSREGAGTRAGTEALRASALGAVEFRESQRIAPNRAHSVDRPHYANLPSVRHP